MSTDGIKSVWLFLIFAKTMKTTQLSDIVEVDKVNGRETPEMRRIRAQLRLGDHWIVESKAVDIRLREYSDEHPDSPDNHPNGPEGWRDDPFLGTSTIRVRYRRRERYVCPHCGEFCKAHEYVERRLNHIPDMGCRTRLVVTVPKLHCENCGRYPRVRCPLARDRVSYTKEFEKSVLRSLMGNTVSSAAKEHGVGEWIVSDILDYRVGHALPEQDLSYLTMVAIDETQRRKGHEYMTVFSDINHDVVYITEGRGIDVFERFCSHLIIQGGHPENIRVVSADMSPTYEAGVLKYFRNATLIWDRYHLVNAINNDLNDIRKRTYVRKKSQKLRHVKYCVLKRPYSMTERDRERLSEIRMYNPELALAYDMKEAFCEILDNTDMYEAQQDFEEWYSWVMLYGCREMRERASKFMRKIDRILAWFDHRVNNGTAEGINSKIQKTKNAAYGYPNLDNFASMCMYRFGNLVVAF